MCVCDLLINQNLSLGCGLNNAFWVVSEKLSQESFVLPAVRAEFDTPKIVGLWRDTSHQLAHTLHSPRIAFVVGFRRPLKVVCRFDLLHPPTSTEFFVELFCEFRGKSLSDLAGDVHCYAD